MLGVEFRFQDISRLNVVDTCEVEMLQLLEAVLSQRLLGANQLCPFVIDLIVLDTRWFVV